MSCHVGGKYPVLVLPGKGGRCTSVLVLGEKEGTPVLVVGGTSVLRPHWGSPTQQGSGHGPHFRRKNLDQRSGVPFPTAKEILPENRDQCSGCPIFPCGETHTCENSTFPILRMQSVKILTWRDPMKGHECSTTSTPPTIRCRASRWGGTTEYPHKGTENNTKTRPN